MRTSLWLTCGAMAALAAVRPAGAQEPKRLSDVDRYDYVLGTQTIGAAYQFTDEPRLVETAKAILGMGSNVLKFSMGKGYADKKQGGVANPDIKTLADLARLDPAHKRVLDMPFAYYVIWAYTFAGDWWSKGFPRESQDREYREIYDFARYLLNTYSGTGKTFYLGHWEGDWHLRPNYKADDDAIVTPVAVQGMIDWLNTRQRAIDDARRDTPHRDVEVYGYCEVNLVQIAMKGHPSVTNSVLPKTIVDYVSYSSYDSGVNLKPALDYIESKLPPKAGVPGKRVWIGEYGFPTEFNTPEQQDLKSRQVVRAALEWGCPFALYWEMYNNEVKAGKQRGFWMIDDKGNKQPVYTMHQRYYQWARQWVADYRKRTRRLPPSAEFRKAAIGYLDVLAR